MPFSSLLKVVSLWTLFLLLAQAIAIPPPPSAGLVTAISPDGYTHTRNLTDASSMSFEGKPLFVIAPSSANAAAAAKATLEKRDNDCGPSTFVDHTNSGSPTVADCECIENYAYANDNSWNFLEISTWYDVISCGTCVFGVQTADILPTYIGNEDIGDLIASSIADFQWFGLVGAQGVMGCEHFLGTSKVQWAIYHT